MRKEILFAIIAGIFFGLIVAFGVWRLNTSLQNKDAVSTEASPTPSSSDVDIAIAKPFENQVITSSPVSITGITKKNAWVVASTEEGDYMARSKADGSFEIEVELAAGANIVTITSFEESGASARAQITLVYSTEFAIKKDTLEETEETSTQEADVVRDKVKEKVSEAQNIPTSYIGVVTDISESTIQLQTALEEIMQVATNEDTSYANTVATPKSIELSDVAIGDTVVAMGYKNGNEVLDSRRVLVTPALEEPAVQVVYGIIGEINKKEVILTRDENTWTLEFGKKWLGPELSELSEGEKLIAIGKSDEKNTISIRSIFVTNTKESSSDETKEE